MNYSFNLGEGERLRDEGIEAAALTRSDVLSVAKRVARQIALSRPNRELTADAVQAVMIGLGFTPAQLGNAAGAIFRGKAWVWTGRVVKSSRKSNRARILRVWRLK